MKNPVVYILANKPNGTLYTGVTSDLPKRIAEHKDGIKSGFAKKYAYKTLVYYKVLDDMESAIAEEKRIKVGSRKKKIELIKSMNSEWKDLYERLF